MAYVGDWNETPNSCHKKELVDTIRNLLVIDGFVYEDALWRTSIRAVVKEILDEFHTDTYYRRVTKVIRLVPSVEKELLKSGGTPPKSLTQAMWDTLTDPDAANCIWKWV